MEYDVKYKSCHQWFWRKLKRVKADGIVENSGNRFFILYNEERVELPSSYEFRFAKERFNLILANMEKETGQKLPVEKA